MQLDAFQCQACQEASARKGEKQQPYDAKPLHKCFRHLLSQCCWKVTDALHNANRRGYPRISLADLFQVWFDTALQDGITNCNPQGLDGK